MLTTIENYNLLMQTWYEKILSPFWYARRLNIPAVIIFAFINLVVFFNAISHDPRIGYDSLAHYDNVVTYAELRFPTAEDNHEYHSPPLPYILPAIAYRLAVDFGVGGWLSQPGNDFGNFLIERFSGGLDEPNLFIAAKVGQLQFFMFSVILTWFYTKLIKRIMPNNPTLQTLALLMLASLSVYYRTFSLVRGDGLLALFAVLLVYFSIEFLAAERKDKLRMAVILGLVIGAATLSRQFGLVYGPAIVVLFLIVGFKSKQVWTGSVVPLSIIATIALGVASLFYAQFYVQNDGSFIMKHEAYTELAETFSLSNQPLKFYISLSLDELFTDPVRPSFLNQLIPISYADTFGDYHSYFLVYGWNQHEAVYVFPNAVQTAWINSFYFQTSDFPPDGLETNRLSISRYLGLVNILAVIPFTLFLAGLLAATRSIVLHLRSSSAKVDSNLGVLIVALSLALFNLVAFFYVTVTINTFEGEVIKATYVAQVFPLLCLMASSFVAATKDKHPRLYRSMIAGLVLFFFFALPTYFTHYVTWAR